MRTKKEVKELTLALGEVSGHHHTVYGDIALLEKNEEFTLFEVKGKAKLLHQEHDVLLLEDEIVVSTQQVEFNPFEQVISKVAD